MVEDDDSSRMLIIDFSRDKARRVVRLSVADIEPGMFVLRRSSGGGDFIVDLANRILGVRKNYLRSRQREWKDKLRWHVLEHGYDETVRHLLSLGSLIASYQNVRNWISPRHIKTNSMVDFKAIASLTGLSSECEQLWDEMTEIRRAHQAAGAQVSKMLLRRVSRADGAELQRLGYVDFDLGAEDGGTLTAQRVLERVPDSPPCTSDLLPMFSEI